MGKENNSESKELELLTDEPIVDSNDVFNNSSYAEVLYRIVTDNDKPQTVGLFGSWGIGKTSIIKTLKEKYKDNIDVFIFNAWKYSGDSFRRQFLLELAESGFFFKCSSKKEKFIEDLKEQYHQSILEDVKEQWKFSKSNFVLFGGAFGVFFLIYFLIFYLFGLTSIDEKSLIGSIIVSSIGATSTVILSQGFKMFKIIEINKFKHQMIYPEQFESKFIDLLEHKKNKNRIAIVIDDLDRCEPDSIMDTLKTVKTYLNIQDDKIKDSGVKPFFIIPIDDQAVLKSIDGKEEMTYEQFRKYFNVTIRVNPLLQNDLLSLARANFKYMKDYPEALYIGIIGNCRDARRLKHFINSFKIKKYLTEQRIIHCFGNDEKYNNIVKNNINLIALLTVLEIQFPEFYSDILKNPNQLLEHNKCEESNNKLRNFLQHPVIKNISRDKLYFLLPMKIEKQFIDLGEFGIKLYNYFNDIEEFDIKKEKEKYQSYCLSDNINLLTDILKKYLTEDQFIIVKNKAISFCFDIIPLFWNNGVAPHEVFNKFSVFINSIITYDKPILVDGNIGVITNNMQWFSNEKQKELINKIIKDNFEIGFNENFSNVLNISEIEQLIKMNNQIINQSIRTRFETNKMDVKDRIIDEFIKIPKLRELGVPSIDLIKSIIYSIFDNQANEVESIANFILSDKIDITENHQFIISSRVIMELKEEFTRNDLSYTPKMALLYRFISQRFYWFNEQDLQEVLDLIDRYREKIKEKNEDWKIDSIIVEIVCLVKMLKWEKFNIRQIDRLVNQRSFLYNVETKRFSDVIQKLKNIYTDPENSFWKVVFPKILDLRFQRIRGYYSEHDINNEATCIYINAYSDKFKRDFENFILEIIRLINMGYFENTGGFIDNIILKEPQSEFAKSILDELLKIIKKVSLNINTRNKFSKIIIRLFNNPNIQVYRQQINDVFQWLCSEDDFIRSFTIENYNTIRKLLDNDILNTSIETIFIEIFKKDDLSKYFDSLRICINDFSDMLNERSWNALSERVTVDVPNVNKNVIYKIELIKLFDNDNIPKRKSWYKDLKEKMKVLIGIIDNDLLKETISSVFKIKDNGEK